MNNPLVSVIIPNYCHSRYLDQRIESILNQTYQNIEIIILDDCSPDNGASKKVIEKYRENKKVSAIEYNDANSGSTFKQWEKGFQISRGQLIWIAESDDFCSADFLQTAVDQFNSHNDVSIVFCQSQYVDEDGNPIGSIIKNSSRIKEYNGKSFIRRHMILMNVIENASSAVFKKEKLSLIRPDYLNYVAAGDYLFWVYLSETGNVIKVFDPQNFFRQHSNKVSPRKLIDGTVSREVYKVVQYLRSRGYVSKFIELFIRANYIVQTSTLEFKSEEVRDEIMLLWNPRRKFPVWGARMMISLYYRFRLYKFF